MGNGSDFTNRVWFSLESANEFTKLTHWSFILKENQLNEIWNPMGHVRYPIKTN